MKLYLFAAGAAFALSACGGGTTDADTDGDGEVSSSEMAAAAEAMSGKVQPEAGQYRTTVTFLEADIPGAPPQVQEMMGEMMSTSTEFCLTPEQAAMGFEESLSEGQQEGCTMTKFTHNGSDIDMAMSCDQQEMGQMTITMTGNVEPTSADMEMSMTGNNPQMGDMSMKLNYKQERIGDCAE
jgi:hypothetical protein